MISIIGAIALLIAFPTMTILIVTYLFSVRSFERYLQQNYPETWRELGEPHLIYNNSLRNNGRFLAYLRNGDYLAPDDLVLNAKGSRVRRLFIASQVGFLMTLISLIAVFVGG
jgi:hypothetical protein